MQESVWAETFKYMADNGVMFEGILLKPAMVTPAADCKTRATPETVAAYTLKMLRRRVPPAVPGIMFLSGGQSELEATLNLNAMNLKPNPWHVSFSYARALQNSVLKAWQGKPENLKAGQEALLKRAKANSLAQLGKYDASGESAAAGERTYEKARPVFDPSGGNGGTREGRSGRARLLGTGPTADCRAGDDLSSPPRASGRCAGRAASSVS